MKHPSNKREGNNSSCRIRHLLRPRFPRLVGALQHKLSRFTHSQELQDTTASTTRRRRNDGKIPGTPMSRNLCFVLLQKESTCAAGVDLVAISCALSAVDEHAGNSHTVFFIHSTGCVIRSLDTALRTVETSYNNSYRVYDTVLYNSVIRYKASIQKVMHYDVT